jgi:hypothetical protein
VFCGKVEAAAVPEGAPAEPDAPDAGVTVDVPGLDATADGTPIFAPIVAVGVTPITLFPTPIDPVTEVVPVGTVVVDPARIVPVGMVVPVEPASVLIPEVVGDEVVGESAPVPVAAVPFGDVDDSVDVVGDTTKDLDNIVEDVGDTVDDVGDTVVVAGVDVAVAGVEVEAPALLPAPEGLNASSSWQDVSVSAIRPKLAALRTVSTINLLCRSKTAGEVVFHRLASPPEALKPWQALLAETGS